MAAALRLRPTVIPDDVDPGTRKPYSFRLTYRALYLLGELAYVDRKTRGEWLEGVIEEAAKAKKIRVPVRSKTKTRKLV